jgi:hypothetical protein
MSDEEDLFDLLEEYELKNKANAVEKDDQPEAVREHPERKCYEHTYERNGRIYTSRKYYCPIPKDQQKKRTGRPKKSVDQKIKEIEEQLENLKKLKMGNIVS